jgi:hypothetical protein
MSIERPLLVTSPSEAHVGRLLPNCPAAPRLPRPLLRFELPGRSLALPTYGQCEINAVRNTRSDQLQPQ